MELIKSKQTNKDLIKQEIKTLLNIKHYSPLDMYIAINENELDHNDWAILISKVDKEDLNAIIAIHSWQKYNFIPENYLEILDYVIYDKDRIRAYNNLQKLSYDELVLFLSKTIHLEWFKEDTDYSDEAFLTEDRVFVIYKRNSEITDIVFNKATQTISLAYLDNMAFGRKLCLDLMATSTSIQEEEALQKKDYILETLGIKTYQETMILYHYDSPRRILNQISKKISSKKHKKFSYDKNIIEKLPKLVTEFNLDTYMNLSSLDNLDNIKAEFYTILNSIIAYNNVLRFGHKVIKDTIIRNMSYIQLGLNIISNAKNTTIDNILEYVKLSDIFRLGFSSIIEIKKYATSIKALIKNSPKAILLSQTEDAFINDLTKTIPLLKKEKLKPITEVNDLKFAKEELDKIMKKLT